MRVYKLVRKLSNGQLASLFINKKARLRVGPWLYAEAHPTKGFLPRTGWHCTGKPEAPHLSMKDRVWVEVEIEDYVTIKRPEVQGGLWYLAQRMRILKELPC